MNTTLSPEIVTNILSQMILDKKVFEAYDVTLAVRKLTTTNILNSDVEDIIRDKFVTGQMEGYGRDYKFIGNDYVTIYCPEGKSAKDHSSESSNTVSEVVPIVENTAPIVEDTVTPIVEDTPITIDSGVVVKLTKDGRVNIPKELLKQITMVDDSYDIYVCDTHKCVTPNTNGCIRFGLRSFGITGDKVSLVANTNSIAISEVS